MNNTELETYKKIESVIAGMTISNNFWGYIFGRIKKISDPSLPSIMGVGISKRSNIISLFFNPKYIEKTKFSVIEQILEHEGVHLLNLHISRCLRILSTEVDEKIKNKKSLIWNIATDCAVNEQINMPDKLIIDEQEAIVQKPKLYNFPNDRSSEVYYYNLLEKDKEKCLFCGGCGESDPDKNNNESSSDNNSDNDDNNSDKNNSETNQGNSNSDSGGEVEVTCKCPGCGKETSYKFNIDDHSQWNNSSDIDSNNPEELARRIDDQIKDVVRKSIKTYRSNSNSRGTLPGYIEELIEGLLDIPKVPYYQIIRSLVKGSRLAKWETAYTRINKKRVYTFFNSNMKYTPPTISPFPGKTRDFTFDIVILIDTSGSQSTEDIAEALSGIKDIIEHDKYCKTTCIEIDTCIGKEYEIKKVSDINFNVTGRGGTVLEEGIIRAKELNPDVLLCFTDGYCDNVNGFPDYKLPKKIIWCISPNGSSENVNKTGYIVFIEDD